MYSSTFIRENFCRIKSQSANGKPRIEFVDLAKGICIILIVVFHAGFVPDTLAMTMSLYFLLSGLFFKDLGSYRSVICNKVNKILIPFCFFTVLYFVPGAIKYSKTVIFSAFIDPIFAPQVVNYPIWFLLCLFWVNIIYYTVQKCFSTWKTKSVVVLIFGICGYFLGYYGIYLPFFLANAFSALPFFYFGILLRKIPILYSSSRDTLYLFVFGFLMVCSLAYCFVYGTPILLFRSKEFTGNPLITYIISLSLVLGLLMICKRIQWLPIISYFGRYSLIVLGLHGLYLEFATVPLRYVTGHVFTDVEILAITLLLCWISIPLFKGLFPSLTAQKDLFKLSPKYTEATVERAK